ncbi:hypothetical protein B0H66DRAFT_92996 [Apodospora peruviana]|uniref:Uncharacterized protein n=1 Tax=Apodospora peruviana TaxID=516989 RepID=A0AAE0MG16_9PEZI|nr:hypothetical protein B0H66DRAFT_92996 [Apodospora peruviana]
MMQKRKLIPSSAGLSSLYPFLLGFSHPGSRISVTITLLGETKQMDIRPRRRQMQRLKFSLGEVPRSGVVNLFLYIAPHSFVSHSAFSASERKSRFSWRTTPLSALAVQSFLCRFFLLSKITSVSMVCSFVEVAGARCSQPPWSQPPNLRLK